MYGQNINRSEKHMQSSKLYEPIIIMPRSYVLMYIDI